MISAWRPGRGAAWSAFAAERCSPDPGQTEVRIANAKAGQRDAPMIVL